MVLIVAKALLTLRELRAAAGAVEAVLLAFLHAGVARHVVLLAELLDEVAVVLQQGAGDALGACAGLAGSAAAVDEDSHVDLVAELAVIQRAGDGVLVLNDPEELGEFTAVDGDLAAARLDADAGDGGLATASAEGF